MVKFRMFGFNSFSSVPAQGYIALFHKTQIISKIPSNIAVISILPSEYIYKDSNYNYCNKNDNDGFVCNLNFDYITSSSVLQSPSYYPI